jgi:hypothetical protein
MEKCLSLCSECQMKFRIGCGFSIKLCSPQRGSQWSEEAVLYVKKNTTATVLLHFIFLPPHYQSWTVSTARKSEFSSYPITLKWCRYSWFSAHWVYWFDPISPSMLGCLQWALEALSEIEPLARWSCNLHCWDQSSSFTMFAFLGCTFGSMGSVSLKRVLIW